MNCGNCKYYRDRGGRNGRDGYGKCLRYPVATETNDGRWCGEHQHGERNTMERDGQ